MGACTSGAELPCISFYLATVNSSKVDYDKLNLPYNLATVNSSLSDSPVAKYHDFWVSSCSVLYHTDVMVYMHDDIEIFDDWSDEIREMFEADPKLAIVGLGGATGLGVKDIYKTPYDITQLIRTGYCSNQTDWKTHGENLIGHKNVAVVDGFFMAIRKSFLDEVKGWSWIKSNFHLYDIAMCLEAIRRGWKVKVTGISCVHHGGGTSTSAEYFNWCRENGTTAEREHQEPHKWLYEEYRDMLPVRVK